MKVNWGEKINLVLSLPGLNAGWRTLAISAPFNNTRTLKFKSQAANAVFFCYSQSTTVASDYWWALFSCLNCTRRFDYRALDSSWLTVAKNAFLGWALNFRVRMLLKGSVNGSVTLCLFVCLVVCFSFWKKDPHQRSDLSVGRRTDAPQNNHLGNVNMTWRYYKSLYENITIVQNSSK